MQHFANFIKLSDENINQARELVRAVKDNKWTKLSKLKPNTTSIELHDNLQHPLVTKQLFKAATNIDPNTLFKKRTAQYREPKMMPLLQDRNNPQRNEINQAIEGLTDVVASPTSKERYVEGLKYEAVLPYLRKKNTEAERLAGMNVGTSLQYIDDNDKFRETYLNTMKRNTSKRKNMAASYQLEAPKSDSVGDKLRAKLKNREAYSQTLKNNYNDDKLNIFREAKLLAR